MIGEWWHVSIRHHHQRALSSSSSSSTSSMIVWGSHIMSINDWSLVDSIGRERERERERERGREREKEQTTMVIERLMTMSCHPQTNPTNRYLNENCCWNGGGAHQGLRNAKISNKSSFGSIDTGSSCANDRMMVTVVTTCLIDFGAHECWYGLQTNSCLREEGQSRDINHQLLSLLRSNSFSFTRPGWRGSIEP